MPLRHQQVCDLLLFELYWYFARPDSEEDMEPGILYDVMGDITSRTFFDAAIAVLRERGLIENVGVMPATIGITSAGLAYIDGQLDDPNSFVAERYNSGARGQIPASDRTVELDHNSPLYQNAIETGEKLIEAIRRSNAYQHADQADKEQRIAELDAGYRLLDARRINPTTVKAVLVGTLAYLAAKFADEPIGELARAAWGALKRLLSLE